MGKGMKIKKRKSKDNRVVLTQAKARKITEDTYWEILSMFLAAAMDLHIMTEDDIVDFAARVNWYFDSVEKDHLITLETVHEIIEENMGLIFEKKQALKSQGNAEENNGRIDSET